MNIKYKATRAVLKVFCCAFAITPVAAQTPFIPYAERSEFALTAPSGLGTGLYGYANPALLNYVEHMETAFAWSTAPGRLSTSNQWGLFTALPRLGFGVIRQRGHGHNVSEYRLGFSGGDRSFGLGIAGGWAAGDTRLFSRQNHFALGGLWRPSPRLSAGATVTSTLSLEEVEGVFDLALRPFASERLTFFGDYASATAGAKDFWSAGAVLEIRPGLMLTGRYFDNRTISLGLRLGLGATDLRTQSRFEEDGEHAFATYAIRLGSQQGNALHALRPPSPRYLELKLLGPIRHRRYAFFDDSQTLIDLLAQIDHARRDPTIVGIAINASGMRANPAIAWELREKLRQIRALGKRVVIYIDRVNIGDYHFASVADHLVIDPVGMLELQGYLAGQTYFKGALEKLGIGFEEWRFFKYKSMLESFARDGMSAGEREQLQALLDDWYSLARSEISKERPLTPEAFDRLVDDTTVFLPHEALAAGLVDRIGRWHDIDAFIEDLEETPRLLIPAASKARPQDPRWGARKKVAIVYALGVCAMDTGLRARTLVDDIASACDESDAVVLRVDSPGGDVLPSDLVANAVQQCRAQKPVIVSQGFVAGSGGYMISMHGDAIVAAPNTITGSIGVISGWAYNEGFKEKLGLSTDHVQVGRRADLPFGIALPLLGLNLPDRNLSSDEKKRMQHIIHSLYADFVAKVASRRDMSPSDIEAIAQGRIWTGQSALAIGLVDRIGGLEIAINLAKEMIGLPAEEAIDLIEHPSPQLFSPSFLQPSLIGARAPQNPQLDYLQFRLRHNGLPLMLVPPSYIPGTSWPDG